MAVAGIYAGPRVISTYQQAREYLEGFIHAKVYEKITVGSEDDLDPLGRMRFFLGLLGNPQDRFESVIVSGTSGKGSTAYLTARMLVKAGYKTGFMSSPHLQKINERMQVGQYQDIVPITDDGLISLLNALAPIIESMATSKFGMPTYYEILAGMTLVYFNQEKVNIAIIEVGLEGKFDATNLLYPLIFVLTNISLDHVAILGDTIEKIAEEATFRIKDLQPLHRTPSPIVVTGVTQPAVMKLVQQRAAEASVQVISLGEHFIASNILQNKSGVSFDFRDQEVFFDSLHVVLLGEYQATNASLAVETILQLKAFGFIVNEQAIRDALSSAFFPGRFEVRKLHGVILVIDGAHNQAKVEAFCSSLHELYKDVRKVFFLAFKKDKDIETLLHIIDEEADAMVMTRFVSSVDLGKNLGMEMQQARAHIREAKLKNKDILFENDSRQGLEKALVIAKAMSGIIVITGSMYFVGEISDILDALSEEIKET